MGRRTVTERWRAVVDSTSRRSVASGSVFSTVLLDGAIRSHGARPARRVIDVGSGESPYRDLLRPERYVGADRTFASGAGHGERVLADVAALPFLGGSFDGVICTEVIEHVADERQLARELARVACPGAVLILSSPFVHGLHEAPYDFRRLTSIGLRAVLEEAGWTIEKMLPVGGPIVVSVDNTVRSVDATLRATIRRLSGGTSPLLALATVISARLQHLLAFLALSSPWTMLDAIDPGRPTPRLTLGYVVVARRRPQ